MKFKLTILVCLVSITTVFSQKKTFYEKGVQSIELENYERAISFLDQEIELHPSNADAFSKRGYAKALLLDHKAAMVDYTQAIYLNPNDSQAFSNRGIAKLNLKDKRGACADWNKAIQLGFAEAKRMVEEFCDLPDWK